MTREQALRFEREFVPRIIEHFARLLDRGVVIEMIAADFPHRPTKLHVRADHATPGGHFDFPLNVFLTWDDDEIERLMRPGGEARFMRYLNAVGAKLDAWQGARDVDLVTPRRRNRRCCSADSTSRHESRMARSPPLE